MIATAFAHASLELVPTSQRKIDRDLLSTLLERGKAAQLARHLGVNESQITMWKNGRTQPGAEHLVGMMEFFGVSAWKLYRLPEPAEEAIASALRALPADERERMVRQFQALIGTIGDAKHSPSVPGERPGVTPVHQVGTLERYEADRKLAEEDARSASASRPKRAGIRKPGK